MAPEGTYSNSISGDVISLAAFDHFLQVWAVMGLPVCYDDHYFLGALPPTLLKCFGAETEEMGVELVCHSQN